MGIHRAWAQRARWRRGRRVRPGRARRSGGATVGWCFLVGVVVGAPVVCQAGANYLAELFELGRGASSAFAAILLLAVLAVTLAGARASSTAQLGLVVVLIALVAVAVVGGAGHLRLHNWTPFAPQDPASVGPAATVLMLSFVGWEAIAPMTGRLRDPDRQLPRVILIAFVVTSAVYVALAVMTIGVLGPAADGAAPLADLLRVAIGPAGALVAAVVAVALVLAAVNAYRTGAAALAEQLLPNSRPKSFSSRSPCPGWPSSLRSAQAGSRSRSWSRYRPPSSSPSTSSARHRPRAYCVARFAWPPAQRAPSRSSSSDSADQHSLSSPRS